MAWGAGIGYNVENLELKLTDITPMISSLLDINIPSNSIGSIPIKALSLTSKQKSEAKTANAKQLHEQVINYEKYFHTSSLTTKAYDGLDARGLFI